MKPGFLANRPPGHVISLVLLLLAVLGPIVWNDDPGALGSLDSRLAPPSLDHPLGTDLHGRDVALRLVHGSRVSLLVGWLSVAVAVILGTAVGLAAGLGSRLVDRTLMMVTDLFLAFPRLFLVLLLISLGRPNLTLVVLVIGLTGWMPVARLVRAETLSLRERDFIHAARQLGLNSRQLAWRHLLPNLLPLIVVTVALRVGGAILTESFLSFLGLGVQEPGVSWGMMIQQGRQHFLDGWWLTLFPGLAIGVTVMGYNLLADEIRDRLDPRRGEEHHA